jgi:nicotinamidase-related amidase
MGISMLIIDPQMDFHSGGSLFIQGADENCTKIAEFIKTCGKNIDNIIVTIDAHVDGHIAQSSVWEDENGMEPDAFTVISHADVLSGHWKPKNPNLKDQYALYTKRLEEKGRFQLTIWPDHCMEGTSGRNVVPVLEDALSKWEALTRRTVIRVLKGENRHTEMYSVFRAEVPMDEDPRTKWNRELMKTLLDQDKLLICGQALSHCVNYSTLDLINHWEPREFSDLYIVTDGTSSVAGFERTGQQFLQDMTKKGVIVTDFQSIATSIL